MKDNGGDGSNWKQLTNAMKKITKAGRSSTVILVMSLTHMA